MIAVDQEMLSYIGLSDDEDRLAVYESCVRGMGRQPTREEWVVVRDWLENLVFNSLMFDEIVDGQVISGIKATSSRTRCQKEPIFGSKAVNT